MPPAQMSYGGSGGGSAPSPPPPSGGQGQYGGAMDDPLPVDDVQATIEGAEAAKGTAPSAGALRTRRTAGKDAPAPPIVIEAPEIEANNGTAAARTGRAAGKDAPAPLAVIEPSEEEANNGTSVQRPRRESAPAPVPVIEASESEVAAGASNGTETAKKKDNAGRDRRSGEWHWHGGHH